MKTLYRQIKEKAGGPGSGPTNKGRSKEKKKGMTEKDKKKKNSTPKRPSEPEWVLRRYRWPAN